MYIITDGWYLVAKWPVENPVPVMACLLVAAKRNIKNLTWLVVQAGAIVTTAVHSSPKSWTTHQNQMTKQHWRNEWHIKERDFNVKSGQSILALAICVTERIWESVTSTLWRRCKACESKLMILLFKLVRRGQLACTTMQEQWNLNGTRTFVACPQSQQGRVKTVISNSSCTSKERFVP